MITPTDRVPSHVPAVISAELAKIALPREPFSL
jgi:hypothetical protein